MIQPERVNQPMILGWVYLGSKRRFIVDGRTHRRGGGSEARTRQVDEVAS